MSGYEAVTIAPAVEGHGEVNALPILLRRIAAELSVWNLQVATPFRVPQTQLIGGGLETAVDKPKVDQAPLAARFDLYAARANSPSFDKLWREVQKLLA